MWWFTNKGTTAPIEHKEQGITQTTAPLNYNVSKGIILTKTTDNYEDISTLQEFKHNGIYYDFRKHITTTKVR